MSEKKQTYLVDDDEYYPFYFVSKDEEQDRGPNDHVIELTDAEYADYCAMTAKFEEWQTKLKNMPYTKGVSPL